MATESGQNQLYEDGYASDGFEPIFSNIQDGLDMLESFNKVVPGQKEGGGRHNNVPDQEASSRGGIQTFLFLSASAKRLFKN